MWKLISISCRRPWTSIGRHLFAITFSPLRGKKLFEMAGIQLGFYCFSSHFSNHHQYLSQGNFILHYYWVDAHFSEKLKPALTQLNKGIWSYVPYADPPDQGIQNHVLIGDLGIRRSEISRIIANKPPHFRVSQFQAESKTWHEHCKAKQCFKKLRNFMPLLSTERLALHSTAWHCMALRCSKLDTAN